MQRNLFQQAALKSQGLETALLQVDDCNGWCLFEAWSDSAAPWTLNIARGVSGGADNVIRISVARMVRVCLFGASFVCVGRNESVTEPNKVAIAALPVAIPLVTSNCYQVAINGTSGNVPVPNHAETVRMDIGAPAARPNTLLTVRDAVQVLAGIRAGEQAVRLGRGTQVDWTASATVDGSVTFFYPF